MLPIGYIVARLIRKARGSAILSSTIHASSKVESGSTIVRTIFDRHSFCGYDCFIVDTKIGAFCSIASNVVIGGATHPMEYVSTSPVFLDHKDSVAAKFSRHKYVKRLTTLIGHDVWIGDRAIVKAGVNVGNGAVVGMGSVVTRDVPDYAIVAGNPARIIRSRFSPEIVAGLQKLEWWHLSDSDLHILAKDIIDPEKLLRKRGLM